MEDQSQQIETTSRLIEIRNSKLKKIVAIGPESTGKSTLCQQLSEHFESHWVPEYAREYLVANGMNYSYADLITIAKGQIKLEEDITAESQKHSDKPLFIDTDMYVMKVWCEYVFGKCHQYVIDQIVDRKYDLYLLCNIDLPWAYDPLREYPNEEPRKELYAIYKDILINQNTPWVEISGDSQQRLNTAVASIKKLK